MLRRIIGAVLFLIITLAFAQFFGINRIYGGEWTVNGSDLIRLHIVAHSDTPTDQMLKLKVRDAVIAYMTPKLKNVSSAANANAIILENRHNITEVARRVLLMHGVTYPVNIQFGQFDFPTKAYGDKVLPAGRYNAVRILLGEAQGGNWWCVLFPPLCFIDANNAVLLQPVTRNDPNAPAARKVELRWKFIEIWRQLDKQS